MFSPYKSCPSSIMSRTDDNPPFAKPWWFHSSPLSLDDPLAPLPKAALEEGTWNPFSSRDSEALEMGWNGLPDQMRRRSEGVADQIGMVDELGLQDVESKGREKEHADDVSRDDRNVIVGIERLHHVDLVNRRSPASKEKLTRRLGPIYWHPLNSFLDSASVMRSTWLHADTFTPVEPTLSRSLEEGYLTLRAWSSTYADELSSALSSGLEAEEKLRWKVRDDTQGREIFFTNATEAWIVQAVGVVQGLFGNKQVLKGIVDRGKGGMKVIRGYGNAKKNENEEPQPIHYTDLIFVIHGIGQKLSERVESFTFTHAINRFRTHLNNERESELIKDDIRSDYHPCILPINWRSRLSFDFDRPPSTASRPTLSRMSTSSSGMLEDNIFTLKDLQPKSIPIVRDLIKDVMLDIPYYLSNHKEKILEAVVSEANRVWELFCRCNEYFKEKGRVHIIGHSLGSVIAMDVLSRQPTYVNLKYDMVDKLHFAFNTTNLFCVGSPAGFFLMLERVSLFPRAGRRKTKNARKTEVEGAHGQFGCLAIDNIYNIYDLTDPVALHMNPAVDSLYAKNNISAVQVPRTLLPNPAGALSHAATVATSLLPQTSSPDKTTIEMETHDFRSEARAERVFSMLNDNGGLDFMLAPPGGWVDNEYVSMLTAHSGYWDRGDFARMIIVETGREDEKTIDWLRAQKKVV